MSNLTLIYDTLPVYQSVGIKYLFISRGKKDIVKAVHYAHVGFLSNSPLSEVNDKNVYNLGFGDYDIGTDTITDSVNSNNGDQYSVLNTVLYTIPSFFEKYPNEVIMVTGSDSSREFEMVCRQTCSRNCPPEGECRKRYKRINVYKRYVEKNYDSLITQYRFFGGSKNDDNHMVIESFNIGKNYEIILVIKLNK